MRHPTWLIFGLLLLLTAAPRAMPAWTVASEFYEHATDHYFLTTSSLEAEYLHASGTWGRTAFAFRVSDEPLPGLRPVCRFLGAFGPRGTHFYTADADECESVKLASGWIFEGDVFYAYPAQPDGSCPIGTGPVYRLYNDGQGGAPSHRFTLVRSERSRMIDLGWVPEGAGPNGVAFCVPISPGVAFVRLEAFAADEWSFVVQTESSILVFTLSFDTVTTSGEDEFPYQATIGIGGGLARWDPFLGRMVLFIGTAGVFEQLVFAFDGEDHVEGCAYRSQDVGYFAPLLSFDHVLYGPCHPIIGGRVSK